MNCEEYRQQLLLMEDETAISESVRQHVANCAACQQYLRENERLRALLRQAALSDRAPSDLRAAVEKAGFQEASAKPRRRVRKWAATAAGVFLVLGGFAVWWLQSQRATSAERLARDFVADHLHYLPGRDQLVSNSASEVEKWLQGRLDFPVRVPALSPATLEDARVCTVAGRKAALVHYRHQPDETLISLFVAPAPEKLKRAEQTAPFEVSYQGCKATLWCRRGLVYGLVAALDDATLKQVTDLVRNQEP